MESDTNQRLFTVQNALFDLEKAGRTQPGLRRHNAFSMKPDTITARVF